jgi:hypothetical protein
MTVTSHYPDRSELGCRILFDTPGPIQDLGRTIRHLSPTWNKQEVRARELAGRIRDFSGYSMSGAQFAQIKEIELENWILETLSVTGIEWRIGSELTFSHFRKWIGCAFACLNANEKIRSLFRNVVAERAKESIECFTRIIEKEDPDLLMIEQDDEIFVEDPKQQILEILHGWTLNPAAMLDQVYRPFAEI